MTDLISPANWGGAQWVLVTIFIVGLLLEAKKEKSAVEWIGWSFGQLCFLAILAWGGFWA